MAGLGSAASSPCVFTPLASGKIRITINGISSTAVAAATVQLMGLRYGTGAIPANGDAATGTTIGTTISAKGNSLATPIPFSLSGTASLTAGTAYWCDMTYATSATADAASVSGLTIAITESMY